MHRQLFSAIAVQLPPPRGRGWEPYEPEILPGIPVPPEVLPEQELPRGIPLEAAISFIAQANGGTLSTTSFTITLPTTAANDIILLEFTHRGTGNGTIGGTYSGGAFALKHNQLYGAANAFSGKLYWSRCTGNHGTQTVTGTGLTNSCAAIVTVYRGVTPTGDPFDGAATIVGEANASGNETQAQINVLLPSCWVMLTVANTPDLAVATQSCTTPGALTERSEVLSTGGTDASISHASAAKSGSGVTGAFTWTQTNANSGSWAYALQVTIVDDSASVTGLEGTGAVGDETVAPECNVLPAGLAGTSGLGTVTVAAECLVSPTGVAATGAVGDVTIEATSPDISVSVTGVAATGELGDEVVRVDVDVPVTGLVTTGGLGDETIRGDVEVTLVGLAATGAVGDETVAPETNVSPTGVAAAGGLGTVAVRIDVTVLPSGLEATGQVGDVGFFITGSVTVQVTGVQAIGAVGTVLAGVVEADEAGIGSDGVSVQRSATRISARFTRPIRSWRRPRVSTLLAKVSAPATKGYLGVLESPWALAAGALGARAAAVRASSRVGAMVLGSGVTPRCGAVRVTDTDLAAFLELMEML